MSIPDPGGATQAASNLRRKIIVNFGLFAVFFVFYVCGATLSTPTFSGIAMIPVFGMPLGLLVSLLVFPLSWALIAIWFKLKG